MSNHIIQSRWGVKPRHHSWTLAAIACQIVSQNAFSASTEQDFALTYGDEETVSIATGIQQPVSRAPAVASIVTSSDIKNIGATDIDDVLETIPGLHVARSTRAYDPIYTIRGIYSETNPQVLMLINGIPITNVFVGDRGQVWGGMPVNDIARIEVIRGPGSAIYGSDAYAGVINIITKDANDIRGTEAGLRAGSFQSNALWLLHGTTYAQGSLAFSLEYGSTSGAKRIIDTDAQSVFDTALGTSASLAPGTTNLGRRYLESRVDASWQNWRFRFGYQGRWDVGTGAGVAQALDPAGINNSERYNADLNYHFVSSSSWDSTIQLSYFDTTNESNLTLFPPGAFGTVFPDGYPNGVIGNPYVYERHSALNLSTFYTGIRRHRIRLGTGFAYSDLYKVKESKNFVQLADGTPVPLGGVVDVSNSAPFISPHNRIDKFLFGQDEWLLFNDWTLTVGIRYDDYSDFGSTINPRAALVWQTAYNLTSKLLYGHAFRAPSFAELYNQNNPALLGNAKVRPETIDTVEIAFEYQPIDKLRTSLNVFHYEMRDVIRVLPDAAPALTSSAQNTGQQTGYGLEWEINWTISQSLSLNANYALQHSEDQTTHSDAGNAPHNEIYGSLNWMIEPKWLLTPQITWVGERQRVQGDIRPPLKGYTLVDVTLRRTQIKEKLELAASIRNLFDADAREPSLSPGLIPNDLPLPERNFYIELRYKI